jgi:hypothetical protein
MLLTVQQPVLYVLAGSVKCMIGLNGEGCTGAELGNITALLVERGASGGMDMNRVWIYDRGSMYNGGVGAAGVVAGKDQGAG